MIIAINGKKGSGKSTVAKELQTHLPHFEIKSFATPIYEIVSLITQHPIQYLKENKSEIILSQSVRYWLQTIGANLRNTIHPDIWVHSLMNQYIPTLNWIIDDCRYTNEIEAISDVNHILIKVIERGELDTHESEHNLDNWTHWDAIIDNSTDLETLLVQGKLISQRVFSVN